MNMKHEKLYQLFDLVKICDKTEGEIMAIDESEEMYCINEKWYRREDICGYAGEEKHNPNSPQMENKELRHSIEIISQGVWLHKLSVIDSATEILSLFPSWKKFEKDTKLAEGDKVAVRKNATAIPIAIKLDRYDIESYTELGYEYYLLP